MIKEHFWKITGLVAILALGGSIVYSQYAANEANEGVVVEAHVKGNPDAPVKMVEYSDFQCPACKQFVPVVEEILNQYGDQISFEYRHFPLINIHNNAVPAAVAAEAAGQQGKFFEMHDKLFENQTVWANSSVPSRYFEQYAEEIGLDIDLFKTHMNASVITDSIKDSFNEARDKGLTSTPSFFLNGEKMTYTTFEEFRNLIDEAVGTSSDSLETSQ